MVAAAGSSTKTSSKISGRCCRPCKAQLLLGLLVVGLLPLLQPACCFAAMPPPTTPPPSPPPYQHNRAVGTQSRSSPLLQFLARRRHPPTTHPTTMYGLREARAPDTPPPPAPEEHPESAQHFFHFLATWPFRGDLPEVRPVVLACMAWTAVVTQLHRQGLVAPVDVTPHSLLSGPLGFFLTFRANEGYNRCNEARGVWDAVLDTSRDMIRAVVACERLIGGPGPARRLLDLVSAYGVLLEAFVTGEERELELRRLLEPKDLAALGAAPPGSNRPLVMTELIAGEVERLARARPDFEASPHFPRILGFIDTLGHHITRCQRLSKPTVPRLFYAHALRFLTLWTFTLPFALLDKFPSAKTLVAAMGLVAWALFGLRELGVKAQFPFAWGFVDLKRLWREVMWDARICLEGGEQAAKTAVEEKQKEKEKEKGMEAGGEGQ